MTKSIEPKIFFTALAFVAVTMRNQEPGSQESADQVRRLAGLIESFCVENLRNPSTFTEETSAEEIDCVIERHVEDLRTEETTVLPEDRATLLRLHDRLQIRNLRRINRVLYTEISDEKLADFVLSYLDEEIEAAEVIA